MGDTRPSARQADRTFLVMLAILLGVGLLALMSASNPLGYARFGDPYFFVKRQLLFGVIPGLVVFFIVARIPYRTWGVLSWWIYALALLLLASVFIPGVGVVINSARSWVNLGPFHLQPAEFAKLAAVIMLAYLLSSRENDWSDWRNELLPILTITLPVLLLVVAQPDVGTLSIIVMALFGMLYLAGVPRRYLAVVGGVGLVVFIALVLVAPYRAKRLTTFLHPELDPQGVGYQMNQAFLAVGSGGFWGLGFGHSRQKFQYLPEVHADSIFAVIAEESGFLLSVPFIALILCIGWRGLKIARSAPDTFGYLLAGGCMIWFLWQSFLNIGAMVGALPLTGVPLPFVSHGGSALVAMFIAMGIVANVSRESIHSSR